MNITPINGTTVEITEQQTTTYNVDDLQADIDSRNLQILAFQQQKVGIDEQIKVQQDMIDKNQVLLDQITPLLPAEPIDVKSV